jgi:solute carrier family 25 carnitine/acylcarnitine transporter 20/29
MYKGATPPLFGWALMDSVQMGSLTTLRLLLSKDGTIQSLDILDHCLAGFGCGIVVSFVASPVEVMCD